MSIDYVMMGTGNLERARAFYYAVLPCLGGTLDTDIPGYGFSFLFRNGTRLWVAPPYNREAPLPGNGIMPGLRCATRAEVDAAYAAAMANGGTDEGAPGPRPLYSPTFYGAYARDPEGNKMSFVHDEPGH